MSEISDDLFVSHL